MRRYRIRLLSRVIGTGYRGLGGPCSSGTGDDDACETLVQYCAWGVVCRHQLPATGRLPSTTSATGRAGFVRRFTGTMLAVRPLASSAAASPSRLPAVARDRPWRLRARRGLPASDAILLCMMWPSTLAGRRLLHSEGARVAFDAFDRLGSRDVPHFVAHSHTPHNCCVRFVAPVAGGSRNTHYQAGATPYPGRTSTGWIAPASAGAFRKRGSRAADRIPGSRRAVRGQF